MSDKNYTIMHSDSATQYESERSEPIYFNRPFDSKALERVEHAHLWAPPGSRIMRLPEIIASMTSLKELKVGPGSVDGGVISGLQQDDLPSSIEVLGIHTGSKAINWPKVVLPNLKGLHSDAPLKFKAECFPRLESISLYPDKSLTNVAEALKLPITELNLLNVSIGSELFELLDPTRLRVLGLLGGRGLVSLEGIQRLQLLSSVRLKNLTSLEDISALAQLPALRRLDVQYCKNISNIDVLNELKVLEDLTLVGCGALGLSQVESKIASLVKCNIGATT